MTLPRRHVLQLAAGAGLLAIAGRAQAYPSRPVRVIVGFSAGGGPDIQARTMA
jgi:tripartite-type tricarboxylate transporter receptor subunit TctC